MTVPQGDIYHALGLTGVFVLIFLLGEGIHHIIPSVPELSRKFVHLTGGITTLSFPYVIDSHWTILVFAVGFSSMLIIAKMQGRLKSVHDIQRKSYGAMLFPVSVYLVFFLSRGKPVLYFISILVMTVSDTLAAVVGGKYGAFRYEVEGITKSLEGSTVFFFVTFLCVHLSLLLMLPIDRLESVLIALVIATLVTGFEAISPTGTDNFFVPLGTYFILENMMEMSLPEIVEQIWILLAMIAATAIISSKSRIFKTTGLTGLILVNYAAWNLCGFYWFLPLISAQVLLYYLVLYFVDKVSQPITGYQIKTIFYVLLLPTLLLFASNAFHDLQSFFLPYVAAIAMQMAGISYFFTAITLEEKSNFFKKLKSSKPAMISGCTVVATSFVTIFPIMLNSNEPLRSTMVVFGATGGAMYLFHKIYARAKLEEKNLLRQQVRLLCTSVAIGLAFVLQKVVL